MGSRRPIEYLIDTSIFVALEQRRSIGALPDDGRWNVSAITIGELKHGALSGTDVLSRNRRLDTWIDVSEHFVALPVDSVIANTWGEYQAIAAGERRRLPVADGLIAATAATHGFTLVTQDRAFEWYPDLDVLVV